MLTGSERIPERGERYTARQKRIMSQQNHCCDSQQRGKQPGKNRFQRRTKDEQTPQKEKPEGDRQIKTERKIEEELHQQECIEHQEIPESIRPKETVQVQEAKRNGEIEEQIQVRDVRDAEREQHIEAGGNQCGASGPGHFADEEVGAPAAHDVAKKDEQVVENAKVMKSEQEKRECQNRLSIKRKTEGHGIRSGEKHRQMVYLRPFAVQDMMDIGQEDGGFEIDVSVLGEREFRRH